MQRASGSLLPPNTLSLIGTGKWSSRPLGSSLGAGREGALDLQTKKVWLVAITSAVGASEFTSHADIQVGSGYTFSFYGFIHIVSTVQILNCRHLFLILSRGSKNTCFSWSGKGFTLLFRGPAH